jgi:hypothetical protein
VYGNMRRTLAQRQRAIAEIDSKIIGRVPDAIKSFGAEYGADAAKKLTADLQSADGDTQKEAAAVLRGRIEGFEELQAARSVVVAEHGPVLAEAFVAGSDVKGALLSRHADLLGSLPETQREMIVDRISADAALDDTDGVGALAAETYDAMSGNDPRWEKAFEFSRKQALPADPYASMSLDEIEGLLNPKKSHDTSGVEVAFSIPTCWRGSHPNVRGSSLRV